MRDPLQNEILSKIARSRTMQTIFDGIARIPDNTRDRIPES
jgi:hypothetical protein